MKLKNKHIVFVSLVLLFISTNNNAQEKIIKLDGIVRTDSIFLENINVINKTQNFGVSSNSKGEFIIYAALGDSILFSSVNYKNRIIKISNTHINNKTLKLRGRKCAKVIPRVFVVCIFFTPKVYS